MAGGDLATPMTMWIVGDLDSSDGLEMVRGALTHLQRKDSASRLGFIHVSSEVPAQSSGFSTILYQLLAGSALHTLAPADLLSLVAEIVEASASGDNLDQAGRIYSEESQMVFQGTPLHAFTSSGWSAADVAAAAEFWKVGSEIASSLGLQSGQTHILVNGRVRPDPLTHRTDMHRD